MKVLHVIASVDPARGGPIEGVRQLALAGRALGHATTVASFDPPDSPFLVGQPFVAVPLGPTSSTYGWTPHVLPWMRAHVGRFDVVVVNGLWQFAGLATWLATRSGGVPYVVFPHGMLDPWFRETYRLKHAKKLAYWLAAERRVLADAAAVVYTCEEERRLAQRTFPGYRAREFVLGYGTSAPDVDAPRATRVFLDAHPALRGQRIVLFMSRIHQKKGCDLLIRAFAALSGSDPRLRLAIAGPGDAPLVAQLRALAAQLGVADRIVWTGMLGGERKAGALCAAEVLALPSHQENFGIVVAEALASGTPVVISDRVNIWREVEAAGAGWVDEDTVEGTTASLSRWLATPPARLDEMRAAAMRCFAERFEIGAVARRLHSLYESVGRRAPAVDQSASRAS